MLEDGPAPPKEVRVDDRTTRGTMAAVMTRLRSRPVPRSQHTSAPLTLGSLRAGGRATVESVSGGIDDATARRLVDLGFTPGALVHVVRCAPFRGPMVFRVADYEIAIRRDLADRVVAVPDEGPR